MSWFIVSKAFCKSMRIIPVSRDQSQKLPIFYLLGMKVKYLSNDSCKNQIDIYRECCYPLDIQWFSCALRSQRF